MSLVVSYSVLSFFLRNVLIRSGTELSQFLRIFLPTFAFVFFYTFNELFLGKIETDNLTVFCVIYYQFQKGARVGKKSLRN